MDEKDKDMVKNGDQEEENSYKDIINDITCKEDLIPFFEGSDRSVNKIYFSEVNKYFYDEIFFCEKYDKNVLNIEEIVLQKYEYFTNVEH